MFPNVTECTRESCMTSQVGTSQGIDNKLSKPGFNGSNHVFAMPCLVDPLWTRNDYQRSVVVSLMATFGKPGQGKPEFMETDMAFA